MGKLKAQPTANTNYPPRVSRSENEFEEWVDKRHSLRPLTENKECSTEISAQESSPILNPVAQVFTAAQQQQTLNSNENHEYRDFENKVVNEIPCMNFEEENARHNFANVSIFGTVMNQQIKLLVDTGAAITVVSEDFYNEVLRPTIELKKNDLVGNIKTADRNISPVSGFLPFLAKIGGKDYVCDASVVPKLAYKIVLGRDFLHKSGAIIDVRGQSVTFSASNTVSFANEDNPRFFSDVKIAKTFVIEGNSEVAYKSNLSIGHRETHKPSNFTLISQWCCHILVT